MKNIIVEKFGSPEVLKIVDVPSLKPKYDEVLVKVSYVGIGAIDTILRRGGLGEFKVPPFVPGVEVSGEVIAVGKEVENIKIGQLVAAIPLINFGGYAEEIRVKATSVVLLPKEVKLTDGASLVNPIAAVLALRKVEPQVKENLIVHAASGGLGGAVIGVAKAIYPQTRVIAVVRDSEKKAYVSSLGSDQVLTVKEFSKAVTDGERYDIVFDPVGGDIRRTSIEALKPLGRIVVAGNVTSDAISDIPSQTVWLNQLSVYGFNLGYFQAEQVHKVAEEVLQHIVEGKISLPPSKIFPFEEVQEAHRYLESGKLRGRILLNTNS